MQLKTLFHLMKRRKNWKRKTTLAFSIFPRSDWFDNEYFNEIEIIDPSFQCIYLGINFEIYQGQRKKQTFKTGRLITNFKRSSVPNTTSTYNVSFYTWIIYFPNISHQIMVPVISLIQVSRRI